MRDSEKEEGHITSITDALHMSLNNVW